MPLMSPGVQAALRKAGVDKTPELEEGSIQEKLQGAGLGIDRTLENLAEIANGTLNESLRLRANETALKLHGALKESATNQVPSFTIVIQDSGAGSAVPQTNPIFLPRQLLNTLNSKKEQQPS